MVHFIIKRLRINDATFDTTFDFDLNSSLREFRNKIYDSNTLRYLLKSHGKVCVYENDLNDEPLKKLFEKYSPELLNKDEITLHLTHGLALPEQRTGIRLLSNNMIQTVEESIDSSILVCPITQELITTAVKLNNRWYERHALAEYLSNQYNLYHTEHQYQDGQNFRITCPMGIAIPEKMLLRIKSFHQHPFPYQSSVSSMIVFLYSQKNCASDQIEYDKLLVDLESTLKGKVATVSSSEESSLPQDVIFTALPVIIPRQPKRIRRTEETELRREADSFIGNYLPSKRRRPS